MEEPIEAPATPEGAEPPPAAKPKPPPGSIFRSDVDRTVEEGLGYFLQRVALEPELDAGRFKGFRIVELRPAEFWEGVDLKPGDVVQQVNGMPIERDIDAYKVFESLRAATSVRVAFTRGGAQRELVYAIVEDGKKPATPAAPPQPASPAPAAPEKAPAEVAPAPTGSG
jgi:hypothetical protein